MTRGADAASPAGVQPARLLLAHRHLAALLCAVTLLLKLLVPTGYMIGSAHDGITIELCSGVRSQPMAMDMPGMHAGTPGHSKEDDGREDHGGVEMPCHFSALSAPSLEAVYPVQLATLAVLPVALGSFPVIAPATSRRSYLRPPLRAPPAIR